MKIRDLSELISELVRQADEAAKMLHGYVDGGVLSPETARRRANALSNAADGARTLL